MLQQYFTPIEDKTIYKPYQIGACIQKYAIHFPEIENKSIVLFSIQDKHGSADVTRKHLYQLAANTSFEKTVLDLGNIPSKKTPAETNLAIQTVTEQLLNRGAMPVLIGDHLDQGEALYKAFEGRSEQVQLSLISSHLPLLEYELLHRIYTNEPNYLDTINAIGFQAPYIAPNALQMLESLNFNHYRLGNLKTQLDETEIYLRNATLTLFDLNAIRHVDAPGTRIVRANGLTGEEACQLARYAGYSDSLRCYALLGFDASNDTSELTAALCAQLIWYFVDGVTHRVQDTLGTHEDFVKYRCDFSTDEVPILFIKSKRTARWWMSIEHPADPTNTQKKITVPCTYLDYQQAANGDTPQRYLNTLKKLS